MSAELPFTGERFVPGTKGEIWVEHWHRYHFAARWVGGKRVLDAACGEGYGSALLARTAAHVTGVDLSPAAVDHARAEYAGLGNVAFACAPCTGLPVGDGSIDVAVSFETLEHIAEQEAFVDELARVLAPGGVLILSCPNRLEYSDKRAFANPFHVRELYREELAQLVARRFPECAWYGQRPTFFSLIAPEAPGPAAAQLVEVDEARPAEARGRIESPLYFLVVASRTRADLEAVAPALSVLSDRGDWVHRDYEKVMGELQQCVARADSLVEQVAVRERSVMQLQDEVRAALGAKMTVEAEIARIAGTLAERDAVLAQRDGALVEAAREIERRRGWRWWLRLPFVRLGWLAQRDPDAGPPHP
jgi:SAM-dependent methyltransferase